MNFLSSIYEGHRNENRDDSYEKVTKVTRLNNKHQK